MSSKKFLLCLYCVFARTIPILAQDHNQEDTTVQSSAGFKDLLKGAPPIQYSTLSGPSFVVNGTSPSSTVVAGSTAVLTCSVKNLHNYTVSWIRSKDTRLLTIGSITYTSDKRFVSHNARGSSEWLLKIHYAKLTDSGVYLCQVSTTPPIMMPLKLLVAEAIVRVLPGTEVHFQLGSRLELICEIEGCRQKPLISWTQSGIPIKDATLLPDEKHTNGSTIYRLTLMRYNTSPYHSGLYSCTSTCTTPVNVTVHVLKGEELAAMQHHNSANNANIVCYFLVYLFPMCFAWSSIRRKA